MTIRRALVLSVVLVGACRSRAAPRDVLVDLGDAVVRVEDVQAQLDALSKPARDRHATAADQQKFLNRLVMTEVLADEARRLGYDRHPDVVEATKKALAVRLLIERFGRDPDPTDRDRKLADLVAELSAKNKVKVFPEQLARVQFVAPAVSTLQQ